MRAATALVLAIGAFAPMASEIQPVADAGVLSHGSSLASDDGGEATGSLDDPPSSAVGPDIEGAHDAGADGAGSTSATSGGGADAPSSRRTGDPADGPYLGVGPPYRLVREPDDEAALMQECQLCDAPIVSVVETEAPLLSFSFWYGLRWEVLTFLSMLAAFAAFDRVRVLRMRRSP